MLLNRTRDNAKSEKLSELTNSFDRFVDGMLKYVEELLTDRPMVLDEFAQASSDELDRFILKKMRDGNKFIGGRFELQYKNDVVFYFSFDIIMQESDKKDYLRYNGTSKQLSMQRLDASAQAELRRLRKIAYEIEEPESGKYSKIEIDKFAQPTEIREPITSVSRVKE